jgi:hypothetical protein
MRIKIALTDDEGRNFEGSATLTLSKDSASSAKGSQKRAATKATSGAELNFSLPIRAFVKRHSAGLSGPKKFVLVLARLADGKLGSQIPLAQIEKSWNSMTALLGGEYNPAHSTRAKDNGWVDSPKKGFYVLLQDWREALNGK